MKELTDTSVLPLTLFLLYFYITVIEKVVEIMGTKKIESKNEHRVNQKFNNAININT